MAIFIPGKSKCAICGRPVAATDHPVLFPPCVANRLDPLFRLSDAVIHQSCLDTDMDAKRLRDAAVAQSKPSARACVVCGVVVNDPDDYFGTGFLSSHRPDLARFNFLHFHRSHFPRWTFASEFRASAAMYLTPPSWEGPVIVFDPLPRWVRRSAG